MSSVCLQPGNVMMYAADDVSSTSEAVENDWAVDSGFAEDFERGNTTVAPTHDHYHILNDCLVLHCQIAAQPQATFSVKQVTFRDMSSQTVRALTVQAGASGVVEDCAFINNKVAAGGQGGSIDQARNTNVIYKGLFLCEAPAISGDLSFLGGCMFVDGGLATFSGARTCHFQASVNFEDSIYNFSAHARLNVNCHCNLC